MQRCSKALPLSELNAKYPALNHSLWGWKRPSGSASATICLTYLTYKPCHQTTSLSATLTHPFNTHKGSGLHQCPQPLPMLGHPPCDEILPNIPPKPPLVHLETTFCHPLLPHAGAHCRPAHDEHCEPCRSEDVLPPR